MKRHFILLLSGSVLVSFSAWAQDNVIRVIQPDGSVEEAQIPERTAPASAQNTPVDSAPQAQPVPPQTISPSDLAVSAPKQNEKPVDLPAKKEKSVKAEKKKKIPKTVAEPAKPVPVPDALGKPMMPLRAKPVVAPDSYITKAQALDIALDYAPPARSFDVLPRTYHDGRFIYVVRFSTEEGPRDILVDAKDGVIINLAR